MLLDFDAKTVSFYHNGVYPKPSRYTLLLLTLVYSHLPFCVGELQYRKATLPAGSLTPVVAMDAGADEIEILPWRDDFVLNNNT